MSGFYLLALIAIWLLVGWGVYRLWRFWTPFDLMRKILHIAIGVLLFSLWFGGAFWEVAGKKMYWDAKVRELCAKDGGIKVYEMVELPPNFIDKFGRISIPEKSDAKSTDEYYYESVRDYSQNGDLTISRVQHQIVRRRDGKVLGELIRYGRSGGDLYGPWEASSFLCPDPTNTSNFENLVFLKEGKK